jgi:hypothetical protein
MNLDKRVVAAIEEAVKELGETPALAQKITAWLDSLAGGNARLADRDSTDRQVELLYQDVVVGAEKERSEE